MPHNFRRRVEAESEGREKKTSKSREEGTPLTNNQLRRPSSLPPESIFVDCYRRLFHLTVLRAVVTQNLHPLMPSTRLFSF